MIRFTCINCQVAFQSPNLQRDHYKSDWHRFNLKRKIAEIPPVTAEEFEQRVSLLQEENKIKSKGKISTYCTACKKSFGSDQSFQNHLQSKKHTDLLQIKNISNEDNIAKPSIKSKTTTLQQTELTEEDSDIESTTSSDTEEVDSDEWDDVISDNNPILKNDCLFCSHHSASLTKNVKHMSAVHSFFIPHIEYLIDLKGLLLYLGEKICSCYMCIWCNDQKSCFVNMEAVRNHMMDKGHIKIQSDTEASLEYLDFYDFNLDFHKEEDTEVNCKGEFIVTPGKIMNNEDTDAIMMLLPSGEKICHRSLMRYFR